MPDQKEVFSDEDFIEIAVLSDIEKIKFDSKKYSPAEYSHIFHATHPNCCSVDRNMSTYVDRLFWVNKIMVNLYFERKNYDFEKDQGKIQYYEDHIDLTSCGHRGDVYGMDIETKYIPADADKTCEIKYK